MGESTAIQWTDATVNFWWGCTKVGPGCDNCYAETFDKRVGGAHWGLDAPRRKIKSAAALIRKLNSLPQYVFIQSMSDLFDIEVEVDWFGEAWEHIEACDRLAIQIVTKRVSAVEKRLTAIGRTTWPRHAGLMITVVNQDEADRDVPRLLALKMKFGIPWVGLSIEPMIGPIDLSLWIDDLDWIVCGGESGHYARPMHPSWPRSLHSQCAVAGVPFHFKQWGEWAAHKPAAGGDLGGEVRTGRVRIVHPTGQSDVEVFEETGGRNTIRGSRYMIRLGKKAAGRLLDGVEHNDRPPPHRPSASEPGVQGRV